MYWPNVQGLRVKTFDVCCVCFCGWLIVAVFFVHELEKQLKRIRS